MIDDALVGEVVDLARARRASRRAPRCGPSLRPMPTFLRIERPTSATLRPSARGGVDHLLHAVDVRREARHDDAPLAARERPPPGAGRRPTPTARSPRGRRWSSRRTAAARPRGRARPGARRRPAAPSTGRLVELVVAGDEHRAELGAERDRAGVGDRVGHVHQLERERAELERLAGLDLAQLDVAELVLVELRARHRDRQRRRRRPAASCVPPSSRSTHGSAPRWSSWPWVMTIASMSSTRSRR